MKRARLGVYLSIALFGLPLRADDALVLPAGAWRFYLVPTWTTVRASYNANSERQKIQAGSGRIESFNLGYALEYGVNNWISAGFQWTPGTTLSSSFDYPSPDPMRRDKAKLSDAFDALVGFKLQLVGSTVRDPRRATGLSQNDTWRLAVGFGLKLPLTRIDWDREATNFSQGKAYLAQAADKHLLTPIMSLHVDYVFLKNRRSEFFVNLYSQYTPYLSRAKYSETSLAAYMNPAMAGVRIDYGHDILIEVDPRYEAWAVPGVLRVGVYLPVRHKSAPATELDGIGQHNASYRATLSPTLDLFMLASGVPLELRIGYQRTFAGRNAPQGNTLIILFRAILL
jgi:hypothetical protein